MKASGTESSVAIDMEMFLALPDRTLDHIETSHFEHPHPTRSSEIWEYVHINFDCELVQSDFQVANTLKGCLLLYKYKAKLEFASQDLELKLACLGIEMEIPTRGISKLSPGCLTWRPSLGSCIKARPLQRQNNLRYNRSMKPRRTRIMKF